MAEAKITVTLDLKEIQDAVIESAKRVLGGGTTGGCQVKFNYNDGEGSSSTKGQLESAVVQFSYQKK